MRVIRVLIVLCITSCGCSRYYSQFLPKDYVDFYDNEWCKNGRICDLHIGHLNAQDTMSIYINERLVIDKISQGYPYPSYIDIEKRGGHGEYYYDFIILKSKKRRSIKLFNLNDSDRKLLCRIPIPDTMRIKATNIQGYETCYEIPMNGNKFTEVKFLYYGDTIKIYTSEHMMFFM